jgi:cytochrome bd-type quinol oxidase subunit 2
VRRPAPCYFLGAEIPLLRRGEQTADVTPAVPTQVAGRDLWRRYRAPLIAAVPAGVVLGAITDAAFSMNTVHAAPQDQIPALLAYASLGAVFALVASIGAVLALLAGRSRAGTSATQLGRIAAGAGAAVLIGVLVSGAISAASTDSWEWYSFYAEIAVITALVAAACASGITAFFQYRHRLRP